MSATSRPARQIQRPRLEALLDRALGHRLTLVVADAGFGKTTLLTSWSTGINASLLDLTPDDADLSTISRRVIDGLRLRVPDLPRELSFGVDGSTHPPDSPATAQQRPEAVAELLGTALHQHLFRDVALVLDNLHVLPDGPSLRFLAGLVRHAPPLLHIVVASRTAPPLPVDRLHERGEVLEIHGADLGFTEPEVHQLLGAGLGNGPGDGAGTAAAVLEATAGWPVAVRMAIEAIRPLDAGARRRTLAALADQQGVVSDLMRGLFAGEDPRTQRLLAVVGLLDEATVELLDHLDGVTATGGPDAGAGSAAQVVASMLRRGLYLEPGTSGKGWFRLHAVAVDVVAARGPPSAEDAERIRLAAADWFVATGMPRAALRAAMAAPEPSRVVDLLTRFGEQLLNQGHTSDVARAVDALPAAERTAAVERLSGETHQLRGQWTQALERYRRAAGEDGRLDPGLAWRMGLIHYLRGELATAVEVYERACVPDAPEADTALLLAWHASAHWKLGDVERCGRLVTRALGVATAVDDARALAAVHTVLGMLAVSEGDRRANDAHYLKAVEYAERAGDVLQLVRIRCNRGSHLVEEGDYQQALHELDIAIRLADLSGFAAFGALALNNRGEAHFGLGHLEEAQRDLTDAAAMFTSLDSEMAAYPLTTLGVLQHLRGDHAGARQTLTDSLRRAERAGDAQGMVPALSALARLVRDEDPSRARELVDRAMGIDAGVGVVDALLAAGWTAASAGDTAAAADFAARAADTAQRRRDRRGAAEALVLTAHTTGDAPTAIELAERAAAESDDLGDTVGWARASLELAARLDPAAARPVLATVGQRMRTIGCRLLAERAEALLTGPGAATDGTRIETLGRFRILRDGTPVTGSAWKSARARTLLKILISRRGRAISREQAMDLLWPGENPAALANRYNVAVSTVRTLLAPDRATTGECCLVVDATSARLDPHRVDIDVERFLDDAEAGRRLVREGRETEGRHLLERAEAAYTGDFLEEDLYDEWPAALREQARAAYRATATRLAALARKSGDHDAAVRYLLRVLQADPFDEPTHLALVAVLTEAGRHGEARRQYRTYCARMEDLGVDAEPFRAA